MFVPCKAKKKQKKNIAFGQFVFAPNLRARDKHSQCCYILDCKFFVRLLEFGVFRAVVDVQNLHIEIKNTAKQMLNARKQGGLYAEHHS